MLHPNLLDQRETLVNQFGGMAHEPFSYSDFEQTRERLITTLHEALNANDREFLLSFDTLAPDWDLYDFQLFPAVQWKMRNLENLQMENPEKYKRQHEALNKILRA